MKRVTLIQCTASKRDQQAPARDLYDPSGYFRDMRAWAESRGYEWYILSAKHGLLRPSDRISPYDERGISEQQACEIASDLHKAGYDVVDITAGLDYTKYLLVALERRGIDVINHFAGQRIGERRKSLKRATSQLVHETL